MKILRILFMTRPTKKPGIRIHEDIGTRKKLLINLFLLLGVILIGTLGYMHLENSTFLASLYMTIITLSTVGFGEVIELHGPSRVLTIIIILAGLTIGAMSLGTITTYFVSGELMERMKGKRMQKKLDEMRDHVIVAGFGKLGREVAFELKREKNNFCIIETDPEHVQQARDKGFLVIQGDASEDDILLTAGVDRAYGLVAALTGESGNVMVTIAARNLNPKLVIVARGNDDSSVAKLSRAGADRVELPFKLGGRRMMSQVLKPDFVEFFDLFMDRVGYKFHVKEFKLSETCPLIGKTLAQSDIRRMSGGALVMAIKRGDQEILLHPDAEQKFQAEDMVLIMGDNEQLEAVQILLEGIMPSAV